MIRAEWKRHSIYNSLEASTRTPWKGSWTQVGGLEFHGYSSSYYVFFALGLSDSGGQGSLSSEYSLESPERAVACPTLAQKPDMCVSTCSHVCISAVSVCMSTCVCICVCVSVRGRVSTCVCVCLCTCPCVFMSICVRACLYMSVHVYVCLWVCGCAR